MSRPPAEREADADVLGLLLDVVRHHAVDPDQRKHQRHRGEAADEHGNRPRPLQRLVHEVVERG